MYIIRIHVVCKEENGNLCCFSAIAWTAVPEVNRWFRVYSSTFFVFTLVKSFYEENISSFWRLSPSN